MKLDLITIGKLSPAGLRDLAELAAVISMLVKVVSGRFGGAVSVRRAGRMVAQYRKQLAARTAENFNMRVKAWVLQCPERIAHVRGVIGEVAIKRWQRNRLIDYAFTEVFSDWKSAFSSAFPNGVQREDMAPRQIAKRPYSSKWRGYNWKPFALVKIPNAERILYGQAISNPKPKPCPDSGTACEEQRTAYVKLWGVDIADAPEFAIVTRPRRARSVTPVRFTPYELVAAAATGVPENKIVEMVTPKITNIEPEIFPPPEHELEPKVTSSETLKDKPP